MSSQGECEPELMFSFNTSGLPALQTNRLANTSQGAEVKVMECYILPFSFNFHSGLSIFTTIIGIGSAIDWVSRE